ncbi:MAG: pyridoxamine 5'-phosphate oxidase family protein [Planctomycetota bacterium]
MTAESWGDGPSPWRPLLDAALAAAAEDPTARFVQLATVGPSGRPANRTVGFRGFLAQTDSLTFTTDGRSRKAAHLARQPWAAVCWYVAATRQQFRFQGPAQVVGPAHPALGAERAAAWEALSDRTRRLFLGPPPGEPLAAPEAFETDPAALGQPPPAFCLLVLEPRRVEVLDVRTAPHQRALYERQADGGWDSLAVNP